MFMTQNSKNNESPIGHSFWSYCVALVFVFAIADVFFGGKVFESFSQYKIEYSFAILAAIVMFGGLARDGSIGLKFVRACSRHKL